MILVQFSMDRVREFEIEGNWGARVNLHGRGGDLIMGEAYALDSGSFTAAELGKELDWQPNYWLRERKEETEMVNRVEWK